MNSFFDELRRRNVFRIAGVYAVVGWLIIQLGIALETTLNLPSWFDTLLTVLVLIGFPFALLFAWAFELTPEGMKRTDTVKPEESVTADTSRKLDYVILGGLALVAGLIAYQMFRPSSVAVTVPQSFEVSDASIAVLPFVDLSPDGDQEYFGDGISEELLNVMAQVQELQVAGRTSSFAFKGQNRDLREIAEILDVAHILEGSVRKSGDRIRVTAQLIQAENGFHMWSDTYDGDLSDIFAFQDEIANAILAELKPMLTNEIAPISTPRTDISAYDLYLLAQQKAAGNTLLGYEGAVEALDQALAIDPEFVPALAWRGYYELMLSDGPGAGGDIPVETASKNAIVWISKALALDPKSADALFAQAGLLSISDAQDEREKAGKLYEQALAIKPNFPLARNDYGYWLSEHGFVAKALNQFEQALAHDPAQADANINLISGNLSMLEFEKAQKLVDRWIAISPDTAEPIYIKAQIALRQGNLAEGIKIGQRGLALALDDTRAVSGFSNAELGVGVFERALTDPNVSSRVRVKAHILQGNKEDALSLARQAAAERPDYAQHQTLFLQTHHDVGEWAEIVRYYDANWESAEAFYETFIYPPFEYVIPALQDAGHPDTAKLLHLARDYFEKYSSQGEKSATMDNFEARLLILEGTPERAIDVLEHAYNNGARDLFWFIDPTLEPLRGMPRFEALKTNTINAINAERSKLGLSPMEQPEPLFKTSE